MSQARRRSAGARTTAWALAGLLAAAAAAAGCCGSNRHDGAPATQPLLMGESRPQLAVDMPVAPPVSPGLPTVPEKPTPAKPPAPSVPPHAAPDQPKKDPQPGQNGSEPPANRDADALLKKMREKRQGLDGLKEQADEQRRAGTLVNHVVVMWLKKPGDKAGRQAILDSRDALRSIPGVVDVSVGECIKSERKVVDSTYDVALSVTFTDEKALRDYATHPKHLKLVEEIIKPSVEKFVVYDFAMPK